MNLDLMKKLCGIPQPQLHKTLIKYLFEKGYKKVYHTDMYIVAEGRLPICLIAHTDTVFSYVQKSDNFIFDPKKKVLWAPGGSGFDDRAGIYAIIQLIEMGLYPSVIFTNMEERGGMGASAIIEKFKECPFKNCKCLIQLDRANQNDCVFYNCDNIDFEEFIEKYGFVYEIGTFTDISIIAPEWKIAAVNLSIGYKDEHTIAERLHTDWCDSTIEKVKNILLDSEKMLNYSYIPYIEKIKAYKNKKIDGKCSKECLGCGASVDYPNEGYYMDDPEMPYIVCNNCYNLYWNVV